MKKNDLILIIVILAISIIALFTIRFMQGADRFEKEVIIKNDGIEIKRIPFNEETEEVFVYEEDGEYNRVEVMNNIVTVSEANCRDQICVKTQSISKNGEIIVCLPNKFTVEIYSVDLGDDPGLDSIAD